MPSQFLFSAATGPGDLVEDEFESFIFTAAGIVIFFLAKTLDDDLSLAFLRLVWFL
jgi:hypothetical protein